MQLARRLIRVLGGRVFWSFGLVTFLMASLLATVNLASRFALKDYVDGQLERTPWDMIVFQMGGSDPRDPSIANQVSKVPGVKRLEKMAVLRAKLPADSAVTLVDGKPLQTPWLTLIAASTPSLLPPQLNTAVQNANGTVERQGRPILALVGPESAMGPAFLALQGAREFSVEVKTSSQQRSIFRTPLDGVVRLDREELTRWMMDQMGSQSYVPPVGAVLLMPYDADALKNFDLLAQGIVPPDMASTEAGGGASEEAQTQHVQKAEYIPEVIYLAQLDRDSLISGWDIETSLANVNHLGDDVLRSLASITDTLPLPAAGGSHMHEMSFDGDASKPKASSLLWRTAGQGFTGSVTPFGQPQSTGAKAKLWLAHGESDPPTPQEDTSVRASGYIVDSTTQVLLQQMSTMARLIGLVTLLIALPLLWMGWMLATNLSGLLMLNERRKLGLMRLRGVPGKQLGRTLLVAVSSGGFAGGALGILFGSIVPLIVYERGGLPLEVLLQPQQLLILGLFLLITVTLSLMVSAKLVNYATSISPLEASGRFAGSESAITNVKFGIVQFLALVLGGLGLAGWVFGFSPAAWVPSERLQRVSVVLDFLSLPLFLFGLASLLASRRSWIQALMAPMQKVIGGRLGLLTQRHMAAKPHRSVAFLMIVALMASVSLYPTVASRSFEDKATRGAQVQIGSDWHFTFNSPDLAATSALQGPVKTQLAALQPAMDKVAADAAKVRGVTSVKYMAEAFLPGFYLPGYGMKGVPLYLLRDAASYETNAYAEPELGVDADFRQIINRVNRGGVAVSPAIADFWESKINVPLRLGADAEGNTISLPTAGTLAFLPGMPPRSVTDRQGYVAARVDYLNYLFDQAAYTAVAANNPKIQDLLVFIPRTVLLVTVDKAILADPDEARRLQADLIKTFPTPPLEIHTLPQEVRKVGNDMFVSLALENMKIYLIGGIVLALIAIFSVALANYAEDQRTLALLRVRGTSPAQLRRFLGAMLLSPAIVGLILGGVTALVAGFGLTNYVWKLREIRSVVQLLKTHLVISELTVGIAIFLLAVVMAAAWLFGKWSFRKSANVVNN